MTAGTVQGYVLSCAGCAQSFVDDGIQLACPRCATGSLLKVHYEHTTFSGTTQDDGVFRYRNWLPVRRTLPGSQLPVVYRSTGLASAIGLSNLWIAFSGHWPERGCRMPTGTFKDLEPPVVLARMPADAGVLVVPSAGNTAAAFAAACSWIGQPCVLIIPESAMKLLRCVSYRSDVVKVITVENAAYNDAIALATRLTSMHDATVAEGGVRNVARRAGLGTVMLAAYEQLQRLPDFYVQAVGSAAGALGCHEVSERLVSSLGTLGPVPRVLLCQNAERSPMLHLRQPGTAGHQSDSSAVFANELVNSTPPYATAGGISEMLSAGAGDVLVADAPAAAAAAAMVEELEGIDVETAPAVAIACLQQAVSRDLVPRDALVLLNITGGGRRRLPTANHPHVDLSVDARAIESRQTADDMARLVDGMLAEAGGAGGL